MGDASTPRRQSSHENLADTEDLPVQTGTTGVLGLP